MGKKKTIRLWCDGASIDIEVVPSDSPMARTKGFMEYRDYERAIERLAKVSGHDFDFVWEEADACDGDEYLETGYDFDGRIRFYRLIKQGA